MTFTYIKINECAEFLISSLSLLFACLKYLYYAQSKKFTRNFYRENVMIQFQFEKSKMHNDALYEIKIEKIDIFFDAKKIIFEIERKNTLSKFLQS